MDRFPALRLILRFGRAGAAIVALIVTALVVAISWSHMGWFSLVLIPFVLAFSYYMAKSYVEIVQIITEMVH
ncbi:MAG: hypothetical protein H6883_00035 [Rhodobiaceae bacterium]|nr:hypothetical protein [Rhodobiaceae bacterium]MCC0054502.1 hypothetical protein [Rhodobiaceae bacterium]